MNGRCFLDSNILIYLYAVDQPEKSAFIKEIMSQDIEVLISTQVLNEFANVSQKKSKRDHDQIIKHINEISHNFAVASIDLETISDALQISKRYKYSYYDSLIVASALEHGCDILLSEDMHNNQVIEDRLVIKNPFA